MRKITYPKRWSDEEEALLIQLYPIKTLHELTEIFGRTSTAINTRASRLSLRKQDEIISKTMSTRYDSQIEDINSMSIDEVPLSLAFKNKEWLKEHYYNKELSTNEIAELVGVTRKNIEYWMRKFDLPRRNGEEVFTERYRKKQSEDMMGNIPFNKGLTKHDHPSLMAISDKMSGENHPNWKGGVAKASGYIKILSPNHPFADAGGYVFEHRLIMEEKIGRFLSSTEVVHHRDQVRDNNNIENLFLFPSASHHSRFHSEKLRNPSITEEEFMRRNVI